MSVDWARHDTNLIKYTTLDAAGEFGGLTALTCCAWVRADGVVANDWNANIMSLWNWASGAKVFVFHRASAANVLRCEIVSSTGTDSANIGADMTDEEWSFCAFTWATDEIKIYQSRLQDVGFVSGSTAISRTAIITEVSSLHFHLGNQADTANSWSGQMLCPAVWAATLTELELKAIRYGMWPCHIRPESLLFWTTLKNINHIEDLSGNGHAATTGGTGVTSSLGNPPMKPFMLYGDELWVPTGAASVPGPILASPLRSFRHLTVR